MTVRAARLRVVLGASIGALDPALWDSLEHEGVPFLKHAFLAALESSGAVGAGVVTAPTPPEPGDDEAAELRLASHNAGKATSVSTMASALTATPAISACRARGWR